LTEQGARLAVDALRLVNLVQETTARLESAKAEPIGHLRMSVPYSFASDLLGPVIGRFVAHYPKISVELVMANTVVDLIDDGFDLAVRIGPLTDSSLIRRKIGTARLVLVASRNYLEQKSKPQSLEDLTNHSLIGLKPELTLSLRGPDGSVTQNFQCRIAANDPKTLFAIMREGGGIAMLPYFLVAEGLANGTVEVILPDHVADSVELSVVYYGHSTNNPRIELFTAFLAKELSQMAMFG
jgi:DNA-binding transcriptional LysR family regulator